MLHHFITNFFLLPLPNDVNLYLFFQVEESWKTVEFIVLQHKDNKDTYILGGTDDIQQLWDDSNINIATLISSHHVGPIKSRVEEWQRQLDLFGKTLVIRFYMFFFVWGWERTVV